MKPKISIVSLRVRDMKRSVAFYRDGLGFPTHNYADGDDYILFRLEGTWLAILPAAEPLNDAPAGAAGVPTVGISHNEPSKAAVDAVFEEALRAGASVVARPADAPWGGYESSFADPDGHVWDVAYNPFTDLT
ncbi:MAG TPA: VOC family protein [Caulobacteraceae bacterium]|jgi:hypothetical protein|nr:VOC family protein [Caulobacteraceae bacterium]